MGGAKWWYDVQSVEILSATKTTTITIESLQTKRITPEGMMVERTGDRGRDCGTPCAVTAQTRAEERGDGDHQQGLAGITSAGRWGNSSLRKRRQKTPHYHRAPLCRGLENRTPNLILHHPRGGPQSKCGSPGMIGADDGWDPPHRDVTNLTSPSLRTSSPLEGDL